jgi:hypothetical protein
MAQGRANPDRSQGWFRGIADRGRRADGARFAPAEIYAWHSNRTNGPRNAAPGIGTATNAPINGTQRCTNLLFLIAQIEKARAAQNRRANAHNSQSPGRNHT